MENLENALEYIDEEIKIHTEKLLSLREKVEELKPRAHELSLAYALTNESEVGRKSKEVGLSITALEREINKLDFYIQSLWTSKGNLTQIMNGEEQLGNTK